MGGEVREMATPYSNQRVLILGAGVTGTAVATALSKRGAIIGIVDENKNSISDFPRVELDSIDLAQWDSIVVSPGWNESHPIIQAALSDGKSILNEIDIAWEIHL